MGGAGRAGARSMGGIGVKFVRDGSAGSGWRGPDACEPDAPGFSLEDGGTGRAGMEIPRLPAWPGEASGG